MLFWKVGFFCLKPMFLQKQLKIQQSFLRVFNCSELCINYIIIINNHNKLECITIYMYLLFNENVSKLLLLRAFGLYCKINIHTVLKHTFNFYFFWRFLTSIYFSFWCFIALPEHSNFCMFHRNSILLVLYKMLLWR